MTRSMFSRLQTYDAFPKTVDDFRIKTVQGGVGAIHSIAFFVRTFSSVKDLKIALANELGNAKDLKAEAKLYSLNQDGTFAEEYRYDAGAERTAAAQATLETIGRDGSGCKVDIDTLIAKVPGEIGISVYPRIANLLGEAGKPIIPVHEIMYVNFGRDMSKVNPFDTFKSPRKQTSHHDRSYYYVEVVPTVYRHAGKEKATSQVTLAELSDVEYDKYATPIAIVLRYDLNPITVLYYDEEKPLVHVLTRVCGIVAGAFVIASFFDSALYHVKRIFWRNPYPGKVI